MRKIYNILIIVATMLITASCANETGDILESIPADVNAVAKVNIESAMKHLGITYDANGVKFPTQIEPLINEEFSTTKRDELGKGLTMLSQMVDLSQVAIFYSTDGFVYAVANVVDESLLAVKLEEELGQAQETDGFVYFNNPSGSEIIALKDSRVWYTDAPNGVRGIKTQLSKAEKASVSSDVHLSDFFAESEDALAVVSPKLLNLDVKDKGGWLRMALTARETGSTIKLSMMNADGTLAKAGERLNKIDNNALKYIPNDALGAVAFAISPSFDWTAVEASIFPLLSHADRGLFEVMMPYIKSIDGTVLLSASAKDLSSIYKINKPENWSVKFMAHLQDGKADEAINKIVTTIEGDYKMSLPKEGDFYVIPFPDMKICLGKVDGYFTLTFGTQAPAGDSKLAKKMIDSYASVAVKTHNLKSLTNVVDNFELTLKVEEEYAIIDIDM